MSISVSAVSAPDSARAPESSRYRTSPTLVSGLSLLRQFTPEQPERGIAELARGMRVSPSTAHRYASTCLELGYLEQDAKRRYRLTRRCAAPGIAALAALEPSGAGERVLRALRDDTGRTVGLAVLDGAEVLYLRRLRGFQRGEYRLERGLGAGSRRPAEETAAGRALLWKRGAGGCAGEWPARIHRDGLIVDQEPRPGRARGIALAVDAPDGRMSAVEVSAPADALSASELVEELGGPLREAVDALRTALGGEGSEGRAAQMAR